MKQIIIDGNNFSNEKEFYDEMERLLAPNHNWRIHELNTFPDLLSGGYGFHDHWEKLDIVWINAAKSRKDLGYEETIRFHERSLDDWRSGTNCKTTPALEKARRHEGPTLFDLIVAEIEDTYNSGHYCTLTIKEGT